MKVFLHFLAHETKNRAETNSNNILFCLVKTGESNGANLETLNQHVVSWLIQTVFFLYSANQMTIFFMILAATFNPQKGR